MIKTVLGLLLSHKMGPKAFLSEVSSTTNIQSNHKNCILTGVMNLGGKGGTSVHRDTFRGSYFQCLMTITIFSH
jgi:hypothetical protein